MKWLGSLLICWGGFLCWWQQAKTRRRQVETLGQMIVAADRLKEGIRQARLPLPVLLEQLRELPGAAGAFFAELTAGAEEDLPEAWRRAAGALPLPPESLAVWRWLGDELRGDETHVTHALTRVGQVLEEERRQLTAARSEADRQSGALCFSGAALLVILLL